MSPFHVPGYDVVELLGAGSHGEVWLAREQATGAGVALKRVREGADLAARDRLRREAAALAGVHHPHVLRLRTVVSAGESLVLVLDLATGGSLARLVATRGHLTEGEVVTVAVPLAQALAAVHAAGLVHGDVTPANVLFTGDGRPVLSDLGVARLVGAPQVEVGGTAGFADPGVLAGGEASPASDVHGLAATCIAALTGVAPYRRDGRLLACPAGASRLLRALWSALSADPVERPTAAQLAVAVFDAAPAAPVQVTGPVSDGNPAPDKSSGVELTHRVVRAPAPAPAGAAGSGGRRRVGGHRVARRSGATLHGRSVPWRAAVAAAVAVAAAAMATVSGLAWAGSTAERAARVAAAGASHPSAPEVLAASAAPADRGRGWRKVLGVLDGARSRAFASPHPSGLAGIYVPDSPALHRDLLLVDRLAEAGLRAEGLRLVTREVAQVARTGQRVRLLVEDVLPPYRLVDGAGSVVENRPGRGQRRWSVTLERVEGRWLVYDVARA